MGLTLEFPSGVHALLPGGFPVTERLGNMRRVNRVRLFEIGYCPRHLERPVVSAGGEPKPARSRMKKASSGIGDYTE
jgi:hypothetical protein